MNKPDANGRSCGTGGSTTTALLRPVLSVKNPKIYVIARSEATKQSRFKSEIATSAFGGLAMTEHYRMPAEWELHESTWLTWPTNKITWPGGLLKKVEDIYLQMITALLPGEKVNLLVCDSKTAVRIAKRLEARKTKTNNLICHKVKTVDTWIRDYGPIFVKRVSADGAARVARQEVFLKGRRQRERHGPMVFLPRALSPSEFSSQGKTSVLERNTSCRAKGQDPWPPVAFTKWIFNAWGGKYLDLARDNGVVDKIKFLKNVKRFNPGIVMEGGSVDVNGRGTLLTTEQCLLNQNRNPKLSRGEIENTLKKFLGVKKIIWLKQGIEGDDTDGHIDDMARFVNPAAVVTAMESDTSDKNHAILKENLEVLKKESDQDGKRLRIFELPMPGRVGVGRGDMDADRLPVSYANFYIGNDAVLVPIYSHRNDKMAVKILKKMFPKRKVVGIECTPLVYGLGSIHCVTQQEPA